MYRPNLQSAALPVPEITAIAVLGCGCEPPILGMEGRKGSGMVPFERAFVDPQADFFYIYGWLIKIYGCFSAKPENCEGILRLKTSAVYQIYG